MLPGQLSVDKSPGPVWQAVALSLAQAGQALLAASNAIAGTAAINLPLPLAGCDSPIVSEILNEFLLAKARAGKSDRYLRQLRVSLKHFAAGRARRALSSITTAEIEKWMLGQEWCARTMRGYVADVRTLYNFAQRRGYVDRNPAAGVELPTLDGSAPIGIHTPDQVKQVLNTARRADIDVCRHLAVRYFAGVRSAEAHRLRETDLKLDQDLIEVPAVKSKTRARRLVTIQPNLRAWLDLGGELRPLGDMTIRAVLKLSKVPWVRNATRHCFVSYHLARFDNAGKTALEAGHTEQVTFAHYRALVTPAVAAEFWSIVPKL